MNRDLIILNVKETFLTAKNIIRTVKNNHVIDRIPAFFSECFLGHTASCFIFYDQKTLIGPKTQKVLSLDYFKYLFWKITILLLVNFEFL